MGRFIIVLMAVGLPVFASVADQPKSAPAGNVGRKAYRAIRTSQPPVIDGRLDDACWEKAVQANGFVTSENTAAQEQTEAKLLYDDDNLYIAYRCNEPNPAGLKMKAVTVREIWRDDVVATFIQPDEDVLVYYQFAANSRGIKFDQRTMAEACEQLAPFSPAWQVKATTGPDYWTAEMSISFKSLNLDSGMGKVWRVNFCRYRSQSEESSNWSGAGNNWHNPPRFGYLREMVIGGKALAENCPFLLRDVRLGASGDNILEAWIENNGEAQQLKIELDITSRTGKTKRNSRIVSLNKNGANKIDLPYDLDTEPGRHELVLSFVDPSTAKPLYNSPKAVVEVPVLLEAYLDRDYYTREKQASLNVDSKLKARQLEGLRIEAEVIKDSKVIDRQAKKSLISHNVIAIPLEKLTPNEYKVSVRLTDEKGALLSSIEKILKKLPPADYEVKIDQERQCLLVDDRPFFPVGVCLGKDTAQLPPEKVKILRAAGFNTLARLVYNHLNPENALALYDSAHENQMKVIDFVMMFKYEKPFNYCDYPFYPQYEKYIETFKPTLFEIKDKPAFLSWWPMDEPENEFEGDQEKLYKLLKEMAPYHPTHALFARHPQFFNGYDWMIVDTYLDPLKGETPAHVASCMDESKKVADKRKVPLIVMPQAGDWAGSSRELTDKEQRCQTYLGIIHRAKGVIWFTYTYNYAPKHKLLWDAMRALAFELKQLSPILVEASPAQTMKPGADTSIHMLLKEYQDKLYLITANAGRKEVEAEFSISQIASNSSIKVLFEDRSLRAGNGAFTDRFTGYSTHVYELISGGKKEASKGIYQLGVITRELKEDYNPDDFFTKYSGAWHNHYDNYITVMGKGNTLSSIAKDINDEKIFSYDPITRTAICKAQIYMSYKSELVIGDKNNPERGESLDLASDLRCNGRLMVYNSRITSDRGWLTQDRVGEVIAYNSELGGFNCPVSGSDFDLRGCDIHGDNIGICIHANKSLTRPLIGCKLHGFTLAVYPREGAYTFVDCRLYDNKMPPSMEKMNMAWTYINTTDENIDKYAFVTGSLACKWHFRIKLVDVNRKPIEGVNIYLDANGGDNDLRGKTDKNGLYSCDPVQFYKDKNGTVNYRYGIMVEKKGGGYKKLKKDHVFEKNVAFEYVPGEEQLTEVPY